MTETLQEVEEEIRQVKARIASAEAELGVVPKTAEDRQFLSSLHLQLVELLKEKNALRAEISLRATAAERSRSQKVLLTVTHWATGIRHRVEYEPTQSLQDFLHMLNLKFDTAISRLYNLPNSALWEERLQVKSDDQLRETIDKIKALPQAEAADRLYVSSEENSPTKAPVSSSVYPFQAMVNNGNAVQSLSEGEAGGQVSDSEGSSSSFLARSSAKLHFSAILSRRDKYKCLVCGNSEVLTAAHVIGGGEHVPVEMLFEQFGISDINDSRIGLLLCANCHAMYDKFNIGIDGNGNVYKFEDGEWRIVKRIFEGMDDIHRQAYPPGKLLEWKYGRFLGKNALPSTSGAEFDEIHRLAIEWNKSLSE